VLVHPAPLTYFIFPGPILAPRNFFVILTDQYVPTGFLEKVRCTFSRIQGMNTRPVPTQLHPFLTHDIAVGADCFYSGRVISPGPFDYLTRVHRAKIIITHTPLLPAFRQKSSKHSSSAAKNYFQK
jgi:hypothetical protein